MAAVRVGIHLPQYGPVAGAQAIASCARLAEDLGYEGLWVSDHVVHPAGQSYPSPYLYDPLATLTYAAAVTDRIGLGTSVLVLPMHEPLALANRLASLDDLSGGRLTLGLGVGWSAAEYAALGMDFATRGRRMDESIEILRAAWRDDPVRFDGEFRSFDEVRVLPKPAGPIPFWIGGGSEPAYRRAVTKGDGFHAIGLDPEQAAGVVARIRRDRPEPSFTISLRTGWDPLGMDQGRIVEEKAAFAEAGIQYVVCAPWRTELPEWERAMEVLAGLVL